MIFLILAIMSSSMISILMRLSSHRIRANLSMLAVNYAVCALLGLAYAGFDGETFQNPGIHVTVWLGIVSGILYLSGFVFFQRNTRKYGLVLSSVFMKLGLLVPVVMSIMLFREMPTAAQIAGFCIAVFAIVLINLKKEPGDKGFGFGLLLMLLMCGGSDAMAKVFERFAPPALSGAYLFFTFAVALFLCLGLVLYKREKPGLWELVFGAAIGIPNFFSAKFLLGALADLPAVVVYPSFSVATMLVVTLAGIFAFRERLRKHQWLAIAVIVFALILLNI